MSDQTCDWPTEGQPCYRPLGHYGLHASVGHDRHCSNCGTCMCSPQDDCWVDDVGDNEMVAVRLPRHVWIPDAA